MTVHDDDILDFDFVDDETRELPPRHGPAARDPRAEARRPSGPRGPRRPQFRTPQGITPLLRLAGFVGFAILVVVLLAVWVQGCAGDDTADDVRELHGGHRRRRARLAEDRQRPRDAPHDPRASTQTELETRLGGLIQQQQLDVTRAQDIDAPGPLTPANASAIEALNFRVSGLQGLLDTFRATKSTEDATVAGQQLAAQGAAAGGERRRVEGPLPGRRDRDDVVRKASRT